MSLIECCNTCFRFGNKLTDLAPCTMCRKWFHSECIQFQPRFSLEGRFVTLHEFRQINPTPIYYQMCVVCDPCIRSNLASHIGLYYLGNQFRIVFR